MHVRQPDHSRQLRIAAFDAQQEGRAERLLAEYLRVWGLRDPSTIAAHCRVWARGVGNPARQGAHGSPRDLCREAMAQAIGDMRQWVDHLSRQIAGSSDDAKVCRGLLAMELQSSIDQYPEALLRFEPLPGALADRLARAARPVVPPMTARSMPAQPLGELAGVLTRPWWSHLLSRCLHTVAQLARLRWSRQG